MTSARPPEIQRLARGVRYRADEIAKSAKLVADEFRWLHGVAYEPRVGDRVKVKATRPDPTRDLATPDHEAHTETEPGCRGCQRDVLAGVETRMLAKLVGDRYLRVVVALHACRDRRGCIERRMSGAGDIEERKVEPVTG